MRIDRTTREVTLVYTHPSVIVKGLVYDAKSGLFMSTGRDPDLLRTTGTAAIMRLPAHQIAMRQGVLYVFVPKSLCACRHRKSCRP